MKKTNEAKSYKLESNKGFTLIEILVVIGIIAILAAIVLIAINPAKQFAEANDTQRESNTNAILNAIGQYMVDNNGNIALLELNATPTEIDGALCAFLVPTYIPLMPTDPLSGLKGESVECVDIVAVGDVLYEVSVDADGRVTVEAEAQTDQDGDATNDPDQISVKR